MVQCPLRGIRQEACGHVVMGTGVAEQLMLGQHINKKGTMEQKGNQVSSLA